MMSHARIPGEPEAAMGAAGPAPAQPALFEIAA